MQPSFFESLVSAELEKNQAEWVVSESYVFIENDQTQAPPLHGWLSLGQPGQGPNFFGKIAGVWATIMGLAAAPYPCKYHRQGDAALSCTLRSMGQSLNSAIVNWFLQSIAKDHPFHDLSDYYVGPECEIDRKTLNEIIVNLSAKKSLLHTNIENQIPIVMPIVFKGAECVGINHIAVIMIKDKCVDYYDSQGITSERRNLSKSIRFSSRYFNILKQRTAKRRGSHL